MWATQSLFQVSSFVDLILVVFWPNARWAPEQFMQTKTPKSKEAPILQKGYNKEICYYNLRKGHFKVFLKELQWFFIADPGWAYGLN